MAKPLHWIAVILFVVGCGRDKIKVYTIPKEQQTPAAMSAPQPELAGNATPQLQWTTPAGWREVPPGEMRVASFRVKGANGQEADVSVVPLAGDAGGDLSNVNRWRDQVGQPPVPADDLKNLAQPVTLAGQPADLYEQSGETGNGDPARILAVIQRRAGTAWFFKMTGNDQFVAQQKPAFVEFLKSIQFAEGVERASRPFDSPGMNGRDARSTAAAGTPHWNAPAGWSAAPAGQFLVAKFTIEGGKAAVNVSSSAGNGGGLAANVNRWRKQLGLTEISSDEITKSVKDMGPVTMVELSGPSASLVGAIVSQPGQTWFYKLMGEAGVVAAQRDAFIKFVREVNY